MDKDCCRHSWHQNKKEPASSLRFASLRCRLLLSLGLICCSLHGATAHLLENRVYNDVAKSFDSQIIHLPDLQTIIDNVVMRVHCSSLDRNTSTCTGYNCVKADSVFAQAGYIPGTEILTPQTFAGVSVPVLVQVLNPQKYCDSGRGPFPCSTPSTVQDRLDCWSRQLLGNSSSGIFTESDLDRILARLSLTYRPTTKDQIAQSKKLTASSVLADHLQVPKGSPIQTQNIPAVSALIISQLFNGLPIGASGKQQHDQVDTNISSLTPNLFIALLFDVDTETGFALSDERLHNIAKKLNIGTTVDHNHGHHRATRSVAAHHEEEQAKPFNRTCWSLDTILAAYGVQEKKPLTQNEFEKLCPALIQQTFYDACEPSLYDVSQEALSTITDAEKYGYGTVAVVTICALSLLGIVFIPLFKRRFYENALQGFIALGVGTLSGDALLHLLPEALAGHKEETGKGDKDSEEAKDLTGLWRATACLGAIYGFYVWETALHSLISHRNKRRHAHGDQDHPHDHHHHGEGGHHDHSHIPDPDAFKAAMAHPNEAVEVCAGPEMAIKDLGSDGKSPEVVIHKRRDGICGMTPLASMLLLSGCLHNFADGLTIAAAFSVDLNSGISTSIAIFCHEVPHELGDFAVLLGSGMSFKRAMILHGLTEAFSLVGFYIGIPISENESARQWIFAVAAGMFLYVALADMLPELKHGAKSMTMVIVQNIGILLGFAIMITMAVFEDAIKI
ncbi:hypothetical protein RvY_01017 [Ramazzottius varieornatus]|uniref:Uncharacterized protein n=1 Tax=Ramazzottius varieornatus TaxID=947166 RepID=A0A1D1UIT5_RAMVA|nr:hypothetical protein RvY_01017 [Ramazzottius varieornatus]